MRHGHSPAPPRASAIRNHTALAVAFTYIGDDRDHLGQLGLGARRGPGHRHGYLLDRDGVGKGGFVREVDHAVVADHRVAVELVGPLEGPDLGGLVGDDGKEVRGLVVLRESGGRQKRKEDQGPHVRAPFAMASLIGTKASGGSSRKLFAPLPKRESSSNTSW